MDPFTKFVLDCTLVLSVMLLFCLLCACFLWVVYADEESLYVLCNRSTTGAEAETSKETVVTTVQPTAPQIVIEPKEIPGPTMPERPLLCVYRCVEAGKRHARFPHDGLCDFLFYHLNGKRVPFDIWEKSRCAAKIVDVASVSKRTLMGVSIDDE